MISIYAPTDVVEAVLSDVCVHPFVCRR